MTQIRGSVLLRLIGNETGKPLKQIKITVCHIKSQPSMCTSNPAGQTELEHETGFG